MTKNDMIISLLKHGRSEEVRLHIKELEKESYTEDFCSFMDQMLDEYKVKRKQVALRSGMSQDYTYKLLRGAKKTTERDYIIAMCIAIGMNLSQVQHALSIYGMPMLNREDTRGNVLYAAIQNGLDIDQTNEWLEKAGLLLLRTNPSMPSAPIKNSGSVSTEQDRQALLLGSQDIPDNTASHTFEEIDRIIEAEHDGNAPMDYRYWGIITVQDENGARYYVEAAYSRMGDQLLVMDEGNYKKSEEWMEEQEKAVRAFHEKYDPVLETCEELSDYPEILDEYMRVCNMQNDVKVMERYDSLIDAGNSPFFRYFLDLDQATDEKVTEIMSHLDDTRNYGMRVGGGIFGGEGRCYLEAFNTNNPADREYLQIIQTKDGYTYSASHESYFMRIELGDLYPIYFGEKREEEYYVRIKDFSELRERDFRLKFLFNDLKLAMHKYMVEYMGGFMAPPGEEIDQEMVNTLIQQATFLHHQGKDKESLPLLREAMGMLEKSDLDDLENVISYVCTCSKLAISYGEVMEHEKMFQNFRKIYDLRNYVPQLEESEAEGAEDAVYAIAEAALYLSQQCQNLRGQYDPEARELAKECIDLLEGKCTFDNAWITLYQAYTKYAYMIDVDQPEEAAKYCRKAISIVKARHLDQMPMHQMMVVTLYNNYAWGLWNKLQSEEAVIYYGMAIELLEGYLLQRSQDPEWVKAQLAHVGGALHKLYMQTDKLKEAGNLKERLLEDGVEL